MSLARHFLTVGVSRDLCLIVGSEGDVRIILWAYQGSNLGPLSYQDSVLPLNYAPV